MAGILKKIRIMLELIKWEHSMLSKSRKNQPAPKPNRNRQPDIPARTVWYGANKHRG